MSNLAELAAGPLRTCVGCRSVRPQAHLIRVVRTKEASLDVGRTLHGRGAWLCAGSLPCLDAAARRGGFARSFREPVYAVALERLHSLIAADQRG